MIALVGFMGAGKTSTGRALAALLGKTFVDVDAIVEAEAGKTVAALFEEDGEAAFRERESAATLAALGGPDAVVSLGGGALGDPSVATALQWATVIHLDVSFGEAMRRVGGSAARPMLARTDPKSLYDSRRAAYSRAADHVVRVDGKSAEVVASEIAALLGRARAPSMPRVTVGLGDRTYDVVVGSGISASLAGLVPLPPDAENAFLVTHPSLEGLAEDALASLASAGLKTHVLPVPPGEASKSVGVAARLLGELAAAGGHRHDLLVGFGGGVVTDLAGFVASAYHRGMPVVHVPTTLLGQVDAAIGGKTAVNLPEGKNLVGTFHQPLGVVCDLDTLRTLPEEELVSGMAEVVKYGLISDPGILDLVAERADDVLARDTALLTDLVTRSAVIKASIVSLDERESGVRAHLNYGHTFGHAIEHIAASGPHPVRHGEAVSLGMMAAAYTAHELGRLDESAVEAHALALQAVGLPTRASFELADLEEAWRHDKKYRRGVRFVLLAGLGRPEAGIEVDRTVLERALRRLRA